MGSEWMGSQSGWGQVFPFAFAVLPQRVATAGGARALARWRDERGYTQTQRACDIPGVLEFAEHGALLGHLWMEGQLGVGDPLVNQGAPTRPLKGGRRA
jgi:hypothetical protein